MSEADDKYPEIKLRGYYTDQYTTAVSQSNSNICQPPGVEQSLADQAKDKEYAPFVGVDIPGIISDHIGLHGPTTEVNFLVVSVTGTCVITLKDFPPRSFDPKVQVPFYTPPTECPRKLQIERRKRRYQSQSLQSILENEYNIKECDLIARFMDDNKDSKGEWNTYLPLEYFDDETFDPRTPEDWLSMGLEGDVRKPVPALCLLPESDDQHHLDLRDPQIVWKWQLCGVLDYDIKTKLWFVQKVDANGRLLDEYGKPIVNGGLLPNGTFSELNSQYWVPRIQMMFLAEDPSIFAQRIATAYRERKLHEAGLRYHLYLDCMPNEGIGELSNTVLKRIIYMAKEDTCNIRTFKGLEDAIQNLEKEVMFDFWRGMNDLILRELVEKHKTQYSFIEPVQIKKRKVPWKGTLEIPNYEFDAVFDKFASKSMLTKPEAIAAICKSQYECLEVRSKLMFHVPIAKHVRLEEFEQTQSMATTQVAMFLKDTWLDNLRKYIRTCLRDSGKGWFNIYETDFYVYTQSKLKKFMEMVKYCMQDTLRYLVMDSLTSLTNMIRDGCISCLNLPSNYEWTNDLVTSSLPPKKNPIFLVDLVLDAEGPHYSTPLKNFITTLTSLFDKAINSVQDVPQLERFVMEGISCAENPLLEAVGIREPPVENLRQKLREYLAMALIPMEAYAKKYDKFMDLTLLDINAYLKVYETQNQSALEIKLQVEKQLEEKELVESTIPSSIIIGPFYVNTEPVRQNLIKKCKALVAALLDLLARQLRKQADQASDEFRVIAARLYEKPNSIEELTEMREWIATIPEKLEERQEGIDKAMSDYELIDAFYYNLSADDFNAKWTTIGWPNKIRQMIVQVEKTLEEDEERFRKLQISESSAFSDKIDTLTMMVSSMASFTELSKAQEVANEVRRIYKQLLDAQALAGTYNNRERLFALPSTNYDKIPRLLKDFEPFKNLWLSAADWLKTQEAVMNDPLTSIDAEQVEKLVQDCYKTMHKSVRIFHELPGVQEVANQIKMAIEEFKPFIPLIQGLRNPGMRKRHWEELSEELGVNIVPKSTLTFAKCLEMRLQDHIETISKVAEVAGKEYSIESALNKMVSEWQSISFDVLPYKNTGTCIIKISEEVNQLLDDHVVMTQAMNFSPYKKPFEERISQWESKLHITQDVLDEWITCQRQWLYLEPIFSSEDINRQLPVESKRYSTMDRIWRKVMKQAADQPQVITLCPDPRLLNSLRECNRLLDQVQKGLSEYLETKRQSFPRFYFLSDDELLEILSQTKDPTAVQPHLRKCFENVAKLNFQPDLEITAMYSSEGECVKFEKTTYPTGNVEEWMLEIERLMRFSLRTIIGRSLDAYCKTPRTEWVLNWPGQVVIAVCQTFWTSEVTEAIASDNVQQLYPNLLKQLDGLRELVRGNLTKIGRMTLSALIVIEVHARDVVSRMMEEGVKNVNDFEWISQLRYYWNPQEEELKLRAVNAEFNYGYEYLGNTTRLVITPLTDRCYLTLTGALHLKFGGAPAGPAGTGKTETTKDLGKAFAIQCVVFNCSDQLDFMAMGKFFKGLASAGAWACFDEFNRIDIEVLSVVAQQITTIQKAQQQRLDRFIFEGDELVLKPSCAVFITMNPGYAGRTELPDNLKALFRPVAMMVPDYALIAEISLFSFGFSDARLLSKKIVTTFKLSSEQLSTQDHYDFGMRAVKSVISAAGNLKRQNPEMDEDLICLRAIRDVNVPKFLSDDLKLFNGIVSDLFPNIREAPVDYGDLTTALKTSCGKMGLLDVEGFLHKCIQLFETTVVRHGLMLVGPTGSGKTKCYKVLQNALTSLREKPSPDGAFFQSVHTYVLNPKSITMGQLYGEFDMLTHEWTDGILSTLIRQGVNANNADKRWYVFDGPVDAVWIENMNTVLDDNKKLCLSSGEIIKLTEEMTMMFEVADLAVASPATVSRCGMVYLEPTILGLDPFVHCWIRRLPDAIFTHRDKLLTLFDLYMNETLHFIRTETKEVIPTTDGQLCFSLLKMLECFFVPFTPKEAPTSRLKKKQAEKTKNLKAPLRPMLADDRDHQVTEDVLVRIGQALESWFIFSLIWSFGATCTNEGRVKFDAYLRQKMKELKSILPFPDEGTVYDYRFDDGGLLRTENRDEDDEDIEQKMSWVHWMHNMPELTIPPDIRYSDIIVPTIDNVRSSHLIEMLLVAKKPVLCVGPTGTGKTMTIMYKLTRDMPKEYIPEFIIFSAKTTARQTQDLIDGKLDKRRKQVYGPPLGRFLVFFIDDLNMPALEVYGAQPPIELIRQWMDFSGWYDLKSIGEFRKLVDVNFIGAMGPPGGGRNPVTARLMRHFNFLAYNELDDQSMQTIFGVILRSWLSRLGSDKPAAHLLPHAETLVSTSIGVYTTIQSQLLPTPAKSHYTFNMRDLSKVFQGMLMMEPSSLVGSLEQLLRLWFHESSRVFQDRLVNDTDREWFLNLMNDKSKTAFQLSVSDYVQSQPLLYGDFLTAAASDVWKYIEMVDHAQVLQVIEENLDDYNQVNTAKMNLVLFMYAVEHICRIARIIRQPQGNALLLGMGGSGRQSLTRLASHMAEYDCFQIELSKNYGFSEWRDDLKKIMLTAGIEDHPVTFLFSDTQIKSESFLEDINNILNAGDVPNIYTLDDLDKIFDAMKTVVADQNLQPTKTNLFNCYTKRVRANLHTVITMSPIGEIFRARLRQFPALVSCCTIDWFSPWPSEALESVAYRTLQQMPELDVDENTIKSMVQMCIDLHQSVMRSTDLMKQELNRHNYVTPTSFLELLGVFSKIYGLKKQEVTIARNRTKIGLDKLLFTEEVVSKLQEELEVMKPELEKAVEESKVTMEEIARDSKIAEETKKVVAHEEQQALKKARECETIRDDAQRDLDEAMPALFESLEALKSLNKNDITEVRAMMRPPEGVRLVMETMCIMKDVKPKKVAGDKPGVKVDDYWEPGKMLLQDPGKFLDSLLNFDRDNIPDSVIVKIKPYIESESFMPAAIAKVSKACTSICLWVRAMYKYYHVAKNVAPKRQALQSSELELAETEKILREARGRLKACEDRIYNLQGKYDECIRRQRELEDKSQLCEARLVRADKLISGLGSEKIRWKESVIQFQHLLDNLAGNVLCSAGSVAYFGPFSGKYRTDMSTEWVNKLKQHGVPHTSDPAPTLVQTYGDPVKLRNWHIFGLPKDVLSIENAVIVQFSRRWPLFIDPQGQANKWIKALGSHEGMTVIKMSDKDFLRSLENSIRFGKPCLLENVGEELDPALEPVLLKQTYKHQGATVIKLGDAVIPYHEDFRFYITTKLPNPHYKPEVSTKVTLVNFTLSPDGLEDQLLGIVVAEERPDLEEAKNQLIVSNAKMKQELKEIEDRILERLSATEGSPVDDVDLIQTLEASKLKSSEIQAKVVVAEQTEHDIDETRSKYIPVAVRTQILFFCVADLANIDPMYQYSLEWFVNIFLNGIVNADKADNVPQRVVNINNYFTFSLYSNVCRSLFEKHKLMFAFLVAIRILQNKGLINMDEYRYLLAGGTTKPREVPNPAPEWISDRMWGDVLTLTALPNFATLPESVTENRDGFKVIFDSPEPHRAQFPQPWQDTLDSFQRILLLRCLRADKVTNAMQDFVTHHLGQRFVEPQSTSLPEVFKDSSPSSPLIFVLSQGTDPASDLYKFADEMRFGGKKLSAISLGQGQGPRAEELMRAAMDRGIWVFFQNCHLAPSWMPALERLVEQIDKDRVHRDFRLWLTSMPSPDFPVFILQNGSKMTVEPPKGLKANLMRTYNSINDQYLANVADKNNVFRHLLLSLAFFNGVLIERKKFGPLGFNIPYEFTMGDLRICMDQLVMFLTEYAVTPYKVLCYTAGHINYGGRITDDWDRRCAMSILSEYYNNRVLQDDYSYSPSNIYHQLPGTTDHATYLEYIRSLPINDPPEIFGLHENANITFAQNETFTLLGNLLKLQPRSSPGGGAGQQREDVVEEISRSLLVKTPNPFNLAEVVQRYPVMYEQSMNTVLTQEVIRYNNLLTVIHATLNDLLKALKGLVVMSASLEEMAGSLFNNRVPTIWANKAYPSLKPLAAWVEDLILRVEFINYWIENGIPSVFWISGFYFPQAFLTGTLQNYARKKLISVDTISFDFQVMKQGVAELTEVPADGSYIRGLFLEGARWDFQRHLLGESRPKELYVNMPVIWLIPVAHRKPPTKGSYECPVYKTLTRAGTLSTTGHSTNFVFAIDIPTDKEEKHWIQRGVALLCALNY
ncbi:Dynein heavy chain axonemal [Paragonimus heterotremus]|uniref:Dynein heavy chain axonemal n=1 Tax=Paragonimus heterotremus TaxID=100268 RepID=A0A8J4WTL7_9TREM|nr:Dynein heavy chain axonemal [Paragonimus heterotremus]